MADRREIGSFTPEQTKVIWELVQKAMSADALRNKNKPVDFNEHGVHRVLFKNDSGEEIPPYACLEVTGTTEEMERTFVTVRKPETICGEYVFNSQFAVDADKWGWAYAFGLVRMRGTASAYSACTRYKPTTGSWDVSEGPGPFIVYGEDTSIDGAVRGRIVGDHCKAKYITFVYNLGGDNSVVTPVHYFDGPNPSTCGTVEVEYPFGEPCTDGSLVGAVYDPNSGKYQAVDTKNSIMGDPVTKDVLITSLGSSGCNVTYTKQSAKIITCDTSPVAGTATLYTQNLNVVTAVTDTGTTIDVVTRSVTVCAFGSASTASIATTECAGPCEGFCFWQWHYGSQGTGYWEPYVECSAGCDCGAAPPDPANANDPSSEGQISEGIPCASTSNTQSESSQFALITGLGI